MSNYDFFNEWAPKFIAYLMADFDLTLEDAAAVIGNAGHESGGFKSLQEIKPLVPGSKGGYGIMQWTGPRRREYEAYCKRNNLVASDMETNYKFLFVELKGPEGHVLPKLQAANGLEAKTELFMRVFLRPGIPHLTARIYWAKRAVEAYKANPPKEKEKDELMNIVSVLVNGILGKNAKAIGAGIGALLAQAVDPSVLGPVVTSPEAQVVIVNVLGALIGAWFAPKNK